MCSYVLVCNYFTKVNINIVWLMVAKYFYSASVMCFNIFVQSFLMLVCQCSVMWVNVFVQS